MHGRVGIADHIAMLAAGRVDHMVMQHRHLACAGGKTAEMALHGRDLLGAEVAAVDRAAMRGAAAHHRQARPLEHRVEIGRDVALVARYTSETGD